MGATGTGIVAGVSGVSDTVSCCWELWRDDRRRVGYLVSAAISTGILVVRAWSQFQMEA
jgi:hypothetical protein